MNKTASFLNLIKEMAPFVTRTNLTTNSGNEKGGVTSGNPGKWVWTYSTATVREPASDSGTVGAGYLTVTQFSISHADGHSLTLFYHCILNCDRVTVTGSLWQVCLFVCLFGHLQWHASHAATFTLKFVLRPITADGGKFHAKQFCWYTAILQLLHNIWRFNICDKFYC